MQLQEAGVVIIGGGPSGLMAAEQILQAGIAVDLYDAMPTLGRKFLLAGIGGLNITHSEPLEQFCQRYGERSPEITALLRKFTPSDLRAWCAELGIETFVGSSGRVFPKEMKAAPLLRAWLTRLKQQGLRTYTRHKWLGWDEQEQLLFQTPEGTITRPYHALVLALGGGSWKKLGSDGAWYEILAKRGVQLSPLKPSNCGFLVSWSDYLKQKCAGQPLKNIALTFTDRKGQTETRKGEILLTEYGVEGSLIYAFSARIRDAIEQEWEATFCLDLCPNLSLEQLTHHLGAKSNRQSWSEFLRKKLHLDSTKITLLFENIDKQHLNSHSLAKLLKQLSITTQKTTPIDEAISTAGGVCFEGLWETLQLQKVANVWCVGEMLDWEAPTGGYLLNACFAGGKQVGLEVVQSLFRKPIG